VIQTVLLFHLVCIGWILFRSTSLSEAVLFLEAFTNWSAFSLPPKAYLLALIVPLAFVELMQYVRKEEFPVFQWPAPIRVACYVTAYLTIMVIGRWDATAFIYFQF
jgi:hypothetical protein